MNQTQDQRGDVYTQITNKIIQAIEAGAAKFEMPWHRATTANARPTNAVTNRNYNGVNILALWASGQIGGFSTNIWASYKQWQEIGAQVRKGEKGSMVVFYKELETTDASEQGEERERSIWMAKPSIVFNASQVDGYELPETPQADQTEVIEEAEAFVNATGAAVHHGGCRAFYRPSTDSIHMPDRTLFVGTKSSTPTEAYYSTLFHELTHWTGAESRLNREMGKRFGDQAYAAEELVAELGAAFLCADLRITPEPREDHASYIDHWLELLKSDKRAIFHAAARASEAANFLNCR